MFSNLSPLYNPKIKEKLFNNTNILFEKSDNLVLKNDYKLRIQKYYDLSKEENIIKDRDSNINNKKRNTDIKMRSKKKII